MNTSQALKTFVESMTDAQVRQFVAHGGFIGLARDTDLSNIQMDSIVFAGDYLANVDRVGDIFMKGCYFSSPSQAAELKAGDLKPAGGKGGDLSARFTVSFVKEARGLLARAITEHTDALDDGIADAQSKVVAERLFGEVLDLYEDAAGLYLKGLVKGRGNLAVFRRDGGLSIKFSVGNADVPDAIDRDAGLAFYVQCAHGHELFGDRAAEGAIAAWLSSHGIDDAGLQRLIQASSEDEEGYVLGELVDAVLAHSDALEALRNEVVAALKKNSEHHKSQLTEAVLAWVDGRGEE